MQSIIADSSATRIGGLYSASEFLDNAVAFVEAVRRFLTAKEDG